MNLDNLFEQFISEQLAKQFGVDYKNFRYYFEQISSHLQEFNNKQNDISNYCSKLAKENEDLEQKINNLLNKIKHLETSIEKQNINQTNMHNKNNQSFERRESIDDVIDKFNVWSCNPYFKLTSEFSYISGDFRIRTDHQALTETYQESKWITNKNGRIKYLLPNPNFFDQMTNITELYKMNLTMLKVKGKNKIKIIEPCEISSSGFIEFPGEIQILP